MSNDNYMVHFKFKLSPEDAENFTSLFRDESSDLYCELNSAMAKDDNNRSKWFKARIEYMKEIEKIVIESSKAINIETGEVIIDSVSEWDKDW